MGDSVTPHEPVPGSAANGAPEATPTPDQLRRQLADMGRELARTRRERDEYRAAAYQMLGRLHPYVTPTQEELHDMLHGPRGKPILEVLDEFMKESDRESR